MERRGLEIAVEIPISVREALGDKAALDLFSWLVKVIPSVAVTREEFKEVILRLENVEKELKGLRADFTSFKGSMDNRFDAVNARIDAVHDRIDALRKDMDERFDSFRKDIDSRFDALRGDFASFQREADNRVSAFQREIDSRFEALRGDFASFQKEVDNRIGVFHKEMESRFEAFRGEVDNRLSAFQREMDSRFEAFRGDFASFQREIGTRLDLIYERMLVQSRWLVGSIAILGTVISILLAIGQFLR